MLSLLLWWFALEIMTLIALPLTLALLRHLPDRGYPFARVLGILLPAFLAWFLGMWQLASFGRGLLVLCLAAVAILSGIVFWKDPALRAFLRERWRLALFYELLFAVVLFAGALLRIYGPWGGPALSHTEQPMDLAFLNGIMQSKTLPPQDPWLAGYGINYYYLGYFLAASLALLTGLPASVAFNLNLATLLALAATGCFSMGYNLTLATEAAARRRAAFAGALAMLLALFTGNQSAALATVAGNPQVVSLNAGEMATVLGARLSGETGAISLGHAINTGGDFGGLWDTIQVGGAPWQSQDDWWWPSRALWDERPTWEAVQQIQSRGQVGAALLNWRRLVTPEQVQRSYAITEFPFFSFYLGDMHPHVMSLPLTLLAMALALNLVLSPERGRGAFRLGAPGARPGPWPWLFLVLNAMVLGALYTANSWDFPTYLLLYGAAWIWRWRQGAPERWNRRDTLALLCDIGIVVGLAIALYLPFYLTFRSLVGSRAVPSEVLATPVLGTLARLPAFSKLLQTLGPVLWDKTSLYTFLVLVGLPLYPALTWFIGRLVAERPRLRLWEWVAIGLFVALAVALSFPLLVIVPLLVLGGWLLSKSRPAEAFALLLLMLALLLAWGCEVVYIRDVFESRMNTIFKFYYQIWMMLAIAGAWSVGQVLRAHLRRPVPRLAWALPLALLLAGGLVYPFGALRMALRERRPWNLDGLAYMQQSHPGDYAGVRWLQDNAAPDAVVLEAVGSDWGYAGRVSAATGRPTLLGWDGHEIQWRGGQPEALAEITPRAEAARRIYSTDNPAEARQLLAQYDVSYVFIGSQELAAYSPEALAKFAQLGTLVFEAPGVQIYQVGASR